MQPVMNDPIHGLMVVGEPGEAWLKGAIDHPAFQRLRHIKQLGMADLVFPGAVHTRFNHAIGVAYIATRVMARLHALGHPVQNPHLVRLAALCHDLGHGPFSHAFEKLMVQPNGERINHEDWTRYFLQELNCPEFVAAYNAVNPKAPINSEDFITIENLVVPGRKSAEIASSLIASELDCDRMDYLLRDSHFCGVAYGKFDLPWLLHCLVVVEEKGQPCLAIAQKGVGAVVGFLMARRQMTHNIYQHPKIRRMQAMMLDLLSGVCQTPDALPPALSESPLGSFLRELAFFQRGSTTKQAFMDKVFQVYKGLTDHHIYALLAALVELPKGPVALKALAHRLYDRELPKVIPVPASACSELSTVIAELRASENYSAWQLGVEIAEYNGPNVHQIKVATTTGWMPATECDPMLQALALEKPKEGYLYLDKSLVKHLKVHPVFKAFLSASPLS